MSTSGSLGTPETKSPAYGAFATPAAKFGVSKRFSSANSNSHCRDQLPLEVEHQLKKLEIVLADLRVIAEHSLSPFDLIVGFYM